MCLKKVHSEITTKITSPRSAWRLMMKQPVKPRLSRRVIKSARVNLNRYWNKFEEMAANQVPLTLMTPINLSTIVPCVDNEINENILNECKVLGKQN